MAWRQVTSALQWVKFIEIIRQGNKTDLHEFAALRWKCFLFYANIIHLCQVTNIEKTGTFFLVCVGSEGKPSDDEIVKMRNLGKCLVWLVLPTKVFSMPYPLYMGNGAFPEVHESWRVGGLYSLICQSTVCNECAVEVVCLSLVWLTTK